MWSLAYGGKGKRKTYVIENDDDAFVGYCSIEPGNTPEIGICLLPDYHGKGIGVNAIRLLWKKNQWKENCITLWLEWRNAMLIALKCLKNLVLRECKPKKVMC